MTDYVGAFLAQPKDIKHYGRKGMKWGQRIFSSKESSSGKSKGKTDSGKGAQSSATKSSGAAPAKRPPGNIQDNVESSSARYARLDQQAKAGKAFEMTEQDLKFYNARTEALGKVNKMNETKPSWLRETTTKVIQQSAQRQMQAVTDAIADKYIGDPIKAALKGSTDTPAAKSDGSKSSLAPDVKNIVDFVTQKPVVATTTKSPGMTKEQSLKYFRDHPIANRPLPENYSPSGNFDLFKQLREEGLID